MRIEKSTRKNKKYMAKVGKKWIHFGDNRYGQYRDRIGLYSDLDHLDRNRRRLYYVRHSGVEKKGEAIHLERMKSGQMWTPKILSHYYLW